MKRLFIATILVFALSIVTFGQQRPLLTEDVDTTPQGAVSIAAGVDFIQNAKFPLSGLKGDLTRVGDVRVRIGLSSNVELQIEGVVQDFLAINSAGASSIPLNVQGNSTNDTGDFTIATKIKIRNESKNFPAIGFKTGFQMPNTDQAKGIGTNQTNVFGKILFQKKFFKKNAKDAKLDVFGNVGIAIMGAPLRTFTQNDVLLYGLAGKYRLTKNVNIVSEVNGRANTRGGTVPIGTESQSQFRIGTQIKASGIRFDTAAIFGLTKNSPRSGVTFGVTYESPKVFTPAQ